MKNLVKHMQAGRVKRPKESHMKIDTKLIDSEIPKYEELVHKFNALENEFWELKSEMETLKAQGKHADQVNDKLRLDLDSAKAESKN